MPLDSLFPDSRPYASGRLAVDSRHTLYWEQSGNPLGLPAVVLHGGPGAGFLPVHRRFFDPALWRVVLFDQRGAGRSAPFADTRDNTTAELVADLERLRESLNIERWLVFGGSWGSTLALAYGQAHPERCLGFVLRGIFLGSEPEIDWFLNGMKLFHPEAWRAFAAPIPEPERGDLLAAYHRRLIDPDPRVHMPAARAWSAYESHCSTLLPPPAPPPGFADAAGALSLARIEAHYFVNRCFLGEGQLLAGTGRLRHLPGAIVQGRFDCICPIASADSLAAAWPEAEYVVVADAGHAALEPGIAAALIAATARIGQILSAAPRAAGSSSQNR